MTLEYVDREHDEEYTYAIWKEIADVYTKISNKEDTDRAMACRTAEIAKAIENYLNNDL